MSSSPDKTRSGARTGAGLAPAGRGQVRSRRPRARAGSALVTLAGLAVLAAACSSGSPSVAATGTAGTTGGGSTQVQGNPQGTRQGQGSGLSGTPSRQQSRLYSGTFSAAFARCMRANGVPSFPDPNGKPDQVPSSGIDVHSTSFQAALYGTCKALAPSDWLSNPLGAPPTAPGS